MATRRFTESAQQVGRRFEIDSAGPVGLDKRTRAVWHPPWQPDLDDDGVRTKRDELAGGRLLPLVAQRVAEHDDERAIAGSSHNFGGIRGRLM
jgi:hypothetical protein